MSSVLGRFRLGISGAAVQETEGEEAPDAAIRGRVIADGAEETRMTAMGVLAVWLLVGFGVARVLIATSSDGYDRDSESSGARAGFNVIFWPFPAGYLVLRLVGWIVSASLRK
jgi:hypothetical protein